MEDLICDTHPEAVERARAGMPDESALADVAELFKVFGDSTRARIISALITCELCVADLSELLNMSVSAVSHQLRILRTSKLVKTRRNGKEIYYSLDDHHVNAVFSLALEHVTEH